MNFSWWRIVMFALAGAAGLAFLAWYTPPGTVRAVDRHTGRMVDAGMPSPRRMRTAIDASRGARALGDAARALDRLVKARYEVANPAALEPVLRLLAAELSALGEPLLTPEGRLDYDEEIAKATEGYFAPIILRRPNREEIEVAVSQGLAGDRLAAWLIAAAGGNPYDVPVEQMRAAAKSFRALGRPRARLRWLVRAFRKAPPTDELCLHVSAAFLEYGRLDEAFAALTPAVCRGTENEEVWRQRTRIARWLSRSAEEAAALEHLVGFEDSAAHRKRLAEIYTFLGRPEKAIPHVTKLAVMEGGPEGMAEAARLAFEAGDVDTAFSLLKKAVDVAEDKEPWRNLLADYLEKDLRFDDAILTLRELADHHPDKDYASRLEAILRRRNQPGALLELLRKKYRARADPKLEAEIIRLSSTLGRIGEIRDLLAARVAKAKDPAVFFENLLLYDAAGIQGLAEKAAEMASHADLSRETIQRAIDALRELRARPGFREVAVGIAKRFPEFPETHALLIETLDWNRSLKEAAAAAKDLYHRNPNDPDVLRAWIDRAAWADLPEMEIRARMLWLAASPDDLDNRRRIAALLEGVERYEEAAKQWKALVAIEGEESPAESRYLAALRAAGLIEEELGYLKARAERPGLTMEQRLALAERFFGGGWMDVALKLYMDVLAADPDHRTALLRVGQIKAWGNDSSGALPYLEHLLAVHGPGDGEVPYLLGEAYFALRREDEGREMYEMALPLLRNEDGLTAPRESMVAKILARLGQGEEARAIYERLTALDPENQDLLLDFVDAMIVSEQPAVARGAVDRAKALDADGRRLLRMEGQVLIMEDRPEEAIRVLSRGLERYGPDAGYFSDLGYAQTLAGEWVEAEESYSRVLELQPDSETAAWSLRILRDRLRPAAEIQSRSRRVGHDSALEVWTEGSMTGLDNRTRVAAALSYGSYSGRAAAKGGGTEDVTADITTLSLSAYRRLGREWGTGGGFDFYMGREGAPPAGFWAGVGWRRQEPYESLSLRLHLNEPLTDPVAAAGLGGRSDGFALEGMLQDPTATLWVSGRLDLERLAYEDPAAGSTSDGQATLELIAGWWIDDRGPRIEERLTARKSPLSLEGTTVASEPAAEEGIRLGTWLTYTGIRLLDDKELAGPLPLGEAFDYVTASARVQGRVAHGLYFEVEGYAGADLLDSGLFGGGSAGLAWRPQPGIELRVRGSYGLAFGREDTDTGSTDVRLALTVLW